MGASNSNPQQPIVLEYSKRRFDGGQEKELIEQIEAQYSMMEQQYWHQVQQAQQMGASHVQAPSSVGVQDPMMAAGMQQQLPQHSMGVQAAVEQFNVLTQPIEKGQQLSLQTKLYKAFCLPVIELILGVAGLIIGTFLFTPLMKSSISQQDVLSEERNAVIQRSWNVIRTSIIGIISSPFQVVKLCMS